MKRLFFALVMTIFFQMHALHDDMARLASQLQALQQRLVPTYSTPFTHELLTTLRSMSILQTGREEKTAIEEYAIEQYKQLNKITDAVEKELGDAKSDTARMLIEKRLHEIRRELPLHLTSESQQEIDRIMRAYLHESSLGWCDCFPVRSRMLMMVMLVRDIKKNYPRKEHELVYTTLGSGGLLQDYLVIHELIDAGYHNIVVNIIDTGYPSLTRMPLTSAERKKKLGTARQEQLAAAIAEQEKRVDAAQAALSNYQGKDKAVAQKLRQKIWAQQRELRLLQDEKGLYDDSETTYANNLLNIEDFTAALEHALVQKELQGGKVAPQQPLKSRLKVNHFDDAYHYMAQVQKGTMPKSDVLVRADAPDLMELPDVYISSANAVKFDDFMILFPRCAPLAVYGTAAGAASQFGACIVAGIKKLGKRAHALSNLFELIETCHPEADIEPEWIADATLSLHDLVCFATKPQALVYLLDYKDRLYADPELVGSYSSDSDDDSDQESSEEQGPPRDEATSEEVDILKLDVERYKKLNIAGAVAEPELIRHKFQLLYQEPTA